MSYSKENVVLERPNYLENQVLVVDGLIGGGKGLLSAITGALPRVEMWIHRGNIEQVCAIHQMGEISQQGVDVLLKSWFDEYFYNLSITREVNFKPSDMSCIFRDARPLRYLARLFKPCGADAYQRIKSEDMILNVMTHSNTAYSKPIFSALNNRLVYVRLVRSPMTEYMINHLARWSKRWGNDQDGMIMYSVKDKENISVPYYMRGREDAYMQANSYEKAVLLFDEWQSSGDKIIDEMKKTSEATIIEIPYEKFVFDPHYYMNQIASALGTKVDKVTEKIMRKQKVPRASLTDAPSNKSYLKLGWSPPKEHLPILAEFEKTRELYSNKISVTYKKLLDDITDYYINRHDIQ